MQRYKCTSHILLHTYIHTKDIVNQPIFYPIIIKIRHFLCYILCTQVIIYSHPQKINLLQFLNLAKHQISHQKYITHHLLKSGYTRSQLFLTANFQKQPRRRPYIHGWWMIVSLSHPSYIPMCVQLHSGGTSCYTIVVSTVIQAPSVVL